MTDFNNIIKEKVEQFEVPFNDAHWAEMEGKLNAAKRSLIIKRSLFAAAGIVTILSISAYAYFQKNTAVKPLQVEKEWSENKVLETVIEQKQIVEEPQTSGDPKPTHQEVAQKKETPPVVEIDPEETFLNSPEIKEVEPIVTETETELELNEVLDEPITPSTEFVVINGNVCLKETVSFEPVEKEQKMTYLWNFGDGTTSSKVSPMHTYKESNTYDVSLTLTDKETGKRYQNIMNGAVNIYPEPNADFSWSEVSMKHDDNKLKYPYTTFQAKSDNANSYEWIFGNGERSDQKNPEILYVKKGEYPVSLKVTTEKGCTNSTSEMVTVQGTFTLNDFAQSAIVLSSTKGNNTFIPGALLGWDVQFEMTITNISGDLVYTTTDKNKPWNGRMNNTGAFLDQGSYLWQVITYDVDGKPYQHQGKISIIK